MEVMVDHYLKICRRDVSIVTPCKGQGVGIVTPCKAQRGGSLVKTPIADNYHRNILQHAAWDNKKDSGLDFKNSKLAFL